MSNAILDRTPAPTDEQIDRILDATADSFVRQLRSPILHDPSEQNLVYEEVTFQALGRSELHPRLQDSARRRLQRARLRPAQLWSERRSQRRDCLQRHLRVSRRRSSIRCKTTC